MTRYMGISLKHVSNFG